MHSMYTDSESEIACSSPGAATVLMVCKGLEQASATDLQNRF